jgi:hypothetical protein
MVRPGRRGLSTLLVAAGFRWNQSQRSAGMEGRGALEYAPETRGGRMALFQSRMHRRGERGSL